MVLLGVDLNGGAARSGLRLVSVVWMVMLPIWGGKGGCMCPTGVTKGAGAPIWWSRSEGCWCRVCVVGAKWVRRGLAKRVHLYGEAAYVGRNVVKAGYFLPLADRVPRPLPEPLWGPFSDPFSEPFSDPLSTCLPFPLLSTAS